MTDERQRQRTGCLPAILFALAAWWSGGHFAHAQTAALQPGNDTALKGPGRITAAQLKNVDLLTIRIRPQWLVKNGRWDFSFVDSCVATARKAGKQYTLLLMGGGPNPTHHANYGFYIDAAAKLGQRYGGDQLLYAVHVTGCSPEGTSEELHWKKVTPAVYDAMKLLITAWSDAFPNQKIIIPIGGGDPEGMKKIIWFAEFVAEGRVIVKHNAMKPKSEVNANHNKLIIWAAKEGHDIGFEMNQPSNHPKFGGTWSQLVAKVKEIERLAGKRFVYMACYPIDLTKAGGLK